MASETISRRAGSADTMFSSGCMERSDGGVGWCRLLEGGMVSMGEVRYCPWLPKTSPFLYVPEENGHARTASAVSCGAMPNHENGAFQPAGAR